VELYLQKKTQEHGERAVPVPLCPPYIAHGLIWARTRANAVRGRELTAGAMARRWYEVQLASCLCRSVRLSVSHVHRC
jgi:hypothetical protein